MLWSPTGPTIPAAPAAAATRFVPLTTGNLGGVARVINTAAAPAIHSFTLGGSTVTNTVAIPLSPGQDIVVAYGAEVTHFAASDPAVLVTPGIGRP